MQKLDDHQDFTTERKAVKPLKKGAIKSFENAGKKFSQKHVKKGREM